MHLSEKKWHQRQRSRKTVIICCCAAFAWRRAARRGIVAAAALRRRWRGIKHGVAIANNIESVRRWASMSDNHISTYGAAMVFSYSITFQAA